jgi:hypothetical protein
MTNMRLQSTQLGTRTAAKPEDLVAGFDYQESMGLMRRPESKCPCKRSFGQAPTKEMQKDMVAMACPTIAVESKASWGKTTHFENPRGGLERLKKVYGYVFVAGKKRRKKVGAHSPIIINEMKEKDSQTEPRTTEPRTTEPRMGLLSEWTQPRMGLNPEFPGLLSEWTQPRLGLNLEWTQPRMDFTLNGT